MTSVEKMVTPLDQARRLEALNPCRSICVTAPAGSGKTELLSQRVLTLLARAEQPEEILAITFTRKAAAEMHHRIIKALQFANDSPEPEQQHKRLTWQLAKDVLDRDQACGWKLLLNPQRLNIQTIDGLCSSLTKQMPILADFGAQPAICVDGQPYYQQAVHHLLARLESGTVIAEDLSTLLRHLDNDINKVERLLMSLLQRRDQWLYHIYLGYETDNPRQRLESTLKTINNDVITELSEQLQPFAAELLPLWDYAGANLVNERSEAAIVHLAGIVELPGNDRSSMLQWQAIAEILQTTTGGWRKQLTKKIGFPTQTLEGDKKTAKKLKENYLQLIGELQAIPGLSALIADLRGLPSVDYRDSQWTLMDALMRVLPILVAELKIVFQQQGEVDFSQMSIAALQALGDELNPTDLGMKLDYRLRHILIDEFQDTAATQFELLKRLVEGWQEYNELNPLQPNTLFIVGDGMQSIYGFREANVGLFLEAKNHGVNNLLLDSTPLQVNFRSSPAVVNWVNEVFSEAFPAVENISRGAVPYEASTAFRSCASYDRVNTYGFTGEEGRQKEAEKILQLIRQAQQENPEGTIAILVRNRSHLHAILPVLSAAGLEWQATDIESLSSSSPIIDLLTLTKALLNIADKISWAALLRSPIVGLDNRDLFNFFNESSDQESGWSLLNDQSKHTMLSKHAVERLRSVREVLSNALVNRDRLPLRVWIEGVWLALGGVACLRDVAELAFVDDYLDLLESHQSGGRLISLIQFEKAVDRLYAAPQATNSRLHVMTIHKSKGLEFDTVILPGLSRVPRSDDKELLMWREYLSSAGLPGLVMSPLAASGEEHDSIYRYLRNEKSLAGVLESTRLLYVAATRAVSQLYLLFTSEVDPKTKEPKPPGKQTLMSSIWPALKDTIEWCCDEVEPQGQLDFGVEAIDKNTLLERLPAHWKPPSWAFKNPLAPYYIKREIHEDEDNTPVLHVDDLPRQLGNVIHLVLQKLSAVGVTFWQEMATDVREQWLLRLLEYEQVHAHRSLEALKDVIEAIENTVADSQGRWLLSNNFQRSVAEYALMACLPSGIQTRVVDRSFIDEQGTRWIIDYKTASPVEGESIALFIEREVECYRPQLAQYQWYMEKLTVDEITGPPIRTALYFTSIPCFHEVRL